MVTHTPIKHVVIIIGENRTFDHVFATYVPKSSSDTVWNLLSEKIVKPDGTPGMNYSKAIQSSASDTSKYELAPPTTPYVTLPPAQAGGPFTPYGCQFLGYGTKLPATTNCNTPANVAAVKRFENGLAPEYYQFLLTGGNPETTGKAPDPRIFYDGQDASSLPPGVYQLTQSVHRPTMPYDSYAADPVHRLFQMWQQLDCSIAHATQSNPSGFCKADLFPWVEVTVGEGSNGAERPSGFIGEGSTAPQFFNMHAGDAPYLKFLADNYAMSDNYHQGVNGGTGANHVILGTGDAVWFSNGAGTPAVPPNNGVDPANPGTPLMGHSSALSEIENPGPDAGHEQLLQAGRLRRRLGQPDRDCAQRELRRRFLRQLRGLHPAWRRGGHQLSLRAEAEHQAQLRGRPLLSRQQLQSRVFRRRQGRFHRQECP